MVNPPFGVPVPNCTTQAEDRITLSEGLEIVQVLSVGGKSEPVMATCRPAGAVAGLNPNRGAA